MDKDDSEKRNKIYGNLGKLKSILLQPKEPKPDNRYKQMLSYLGKEERNTTIKLERWFPGVYCPECKSKDIKVIEDNLGGENLYRCNTCEKEFNDEDESPFKGSSIPVQTWLECWYLLGISTSIEYIAEKLNLDTQTVALMIRQLQRLFGTKQALNRYNSYDEWYDKDTVAVQEIVEKHDQLLGKYATDQAKDTREDAKQRSKGPRSRR